MLPKSFRVGSGLICALIAVCFLALPSIASAQYVPHVLVANSRQFKPRKIDKKLVDPWGIAYLSRNTFWLADQNTSVLTAYRKGKVARRDVIDIPCEGASGPLVPCPNAPERPSFPPKLGPTGLVKNIYAVDGDFTISHGGTAAPATLIFDTADGLVGGWNPQVSRHHGIVEVNNSGSAVYKGLALAPPNIGPYLYATNNAGTEIDVFDSSFNQVGSFSPPVPDSSYHPHGVDIINGNLYVTFAGMVPGGVIDVCDLNSSPTAPTCKTLAYSDSAPYVLNAPWGVALAPSDFGSVSNDLLVGNVNTGYIDALNPLNGDFIGTLNKPDGTPISYRGMWDMDFESARNGKPLLYFAAGPGTGTALFSEGVFGFISSVGKQP